MQLSAQITNSYNLSDYKLPEIRYQSLDAGIRLDGSSTSYEVDNYSTDRNTYFGNVNARYLSYLNSERFQRNSIIGINFQGEGYRNNDSTGKLKSSVFSPNISYRIENRTFFNNKFFVETDLLADYSFNTHKYSMKVDDNVLSDYGANRHEIVVSLPLKVGIGRIEPVHDYYRAIYIYEELLGSERAIAGKSDEEVLQLATLISKLKRTRSFDSRIKNIQDIEAIDSFLIANNYKTISDARYFAILVDNWNFVPAYARNSGTTIALAFTPAYYYSFHESGNDESTTDATTKAWSTIGGLELKHEKPINLFWQSSTFINAYTGLTNIKVDYSNSDQSSNDEEIYPNITAGLEQRIGYYPNTRTRVSLSLGLMYGQIFDRTDEEKGIYGVEGNHINPYAGLSAYYYFSPRLRLDFRSNYSYRAWESPDGIIASTSANILYFNPNGLFDLRYSSKAKNSSASFNLSLIYSIF